MATRGRPRSFDRQQALLRACDVFWNLGYESTTLTDLQDAMGGITAPSFYAAFGSKEALFREVIQHHVETDGVHALRALTDTADARSAIESMLTAATKAYTQRGKPRGCMLVLGAMNCAPDSRALQDWLRELRLQRFKEIRRRLDRGVADGDLPATTDVAALTSYYVTILDGLALQSRDGVSRRALEASVTCAMAAWDQLVGTSPRQRSSNGSNARRTQSA